MNGKRGWRPGREPLVPNYEPRDREAQPRAKGKKSGEDHDPVINDVVGVGPDAGPDFSQERDDLESGREHSEYDADDQRPDRGVGVEGMGDAPEHGGPGDDGQRLGGAVGP